MAKALLSLCLRLTPKRRWAQFSLGTLFLVVTALCIWLGIVVNRAHRQREAVAAIEALGGREEYVEPGSAVVREALPRRILRPWLPRDYFDQVQGIYLARSKVTDAGLAHLAGLKGLRRLNLEGTQVTDAGLVHLRGLKRLQMLDLDDTQVADTGLMHLQGLTRLRVLSLDRTRVSNAGLAHLQGLTGLETLYVIGTRATKAGVAQFRSVRPKCHITGP